MTIIDFLISIRILMMNMIIRPIKIIRKYENYIGNHNYDDKSNILTILMK